MAMASSAKQITLFFFLLTLSSSLHTHARDSQLFNKVLSTNNDIPKDKQFPNLEKKEEQQQQQEQQDPAFLPESENGYGLYGHESGQLPPSATGETTITESKRPLSKYLPKNYNPVAYVTQPEDFNDSGETFSEDKSFSTTTNPYTDNNYYNNAGKTYYNNNNNQQEKETYQYGSFPSDTENNNYYTGGSSFNSQPEGLRENSFSGGATLSSRDRSFSYGGNSFRPQGMSDTRSLENGKYFYDINTEKYSSNHPYESLRGNARARNYYGNSENAYEFNNENSIGGYGQNQAEFTEEQNYNLP